MAPMTASSCAMLNTQPPVFFTGVVDGLTSICATAICADPMIRTIEPMSAAGSLRKVFIARILATPEPGGNRRADTS